MGCAQVMLGSASPARRALAVLLVAMTLLAGCDRKPPQSPQSARRANGPPHQLTKNDMSEAEQKYGIAPIPDPSVTYQPAVILVGGGAEAIRELSPNGFMWTIDGSAPHANELVPGKIFFMTGRAVGRVLDVRKDGGNLVVTVGPVDITDVISEAHIHVDAMPVNFGDALAFTSPDLPGQLVPLTRSARAAAASPASYAGESGWRFYKTQAAATPPTAGAPAPTRNYTEKNFKTTPFVSPTGIGIDVSVDDNGFKLATQAVLHLLSPTLKVDIDITPRGGVETAALVLTGAAGLNWNFKMGSEKTMTAAVAALLQPNVDFRIPIAAVGGIPLAITVRQRFLVRTGLEVKNSTLSATGGYTFTGAFKVGYLHKFWTAEAPSDYTVEHSMAKTGDGVSLGIQGLNLGDTVRIFVGMGAFGFATGPYLSFNSAIGAFRNSSIGMLQCNGATLVVKLSGGVGYVIPKSVTNLINSVLRALNIKYEITGEGGLEPSTPLTVIEKTGQIGGCNVDKDPNEKGSLPGGP
jgi:hypothetical protein